MMSRRLRRLLLLGLVVVLAATILWERRLRVDHRLIGRWSWNFLNIAGGPLDVGIGRYGAVEISAWNEDGEKILGSPATYRCWIENEEFVMQERQAAPAHWPFWRRVEYLLESRLLSRQPPPSMDRFHIREITTDRIRLSIVPDPETPAIEILLTRNPEDDRSPRFSATPPREPQP